MLRTHKTYLYLADFEESLNQALHMISSNNSTGLCGKTDCFLLFLSDCMDSKGKKGREEGKQEHVV